MKDYTQELEELVIELKGIESCGTYEQLYKVFKGDNFMKDFILNCETNDKIEFNKMQQWLIKRYEEKIMILLKENI